jgi:hypothetical protein
MRRVRQGVCAAFAAGLLLVSGCNSGSSTEPKPGDPPIPTYPHGRQMPGAGKPGTEAGTDGKPAVPLAPPKG